jgi:site-specific DNA-methyltransferase (adenine-specific)
MENRYQLHHGDCLEVLKTLPECSVDAVVTDPPYGLSFMGKKWDYDVPSVEVWQECLRVLKPGGHLLAFAGTRTQHRMAVRIEDAGFEIRDLIAWVYGSGFPKSLNVANAIHDAAIGQPQGGAKPGSKNHGKFKGGCSDENEAGRGFGAGPGQFMAESGSKSERNLVEQAQTWQGWGTALKPAFEPITMARKPFASTVAANVLEHGVGGLNVDGCRVGFISYSDMEEAAAAAAQRACQDQNKNRTAYGNFDNGPASLQPYLDRMELGRWPANFIHDGSEGATELLGDAARFFYTAKASKADRDAGCEAMEAVKPRQVMGLSDSGGERSAVRNTPSRNHHPTVKPTDLMRYLCRLVTPPGGIVLDPFTGSGSTGKAAILEGFRFIGIEREAEYIEIARARIQREADKPRQPTLFD